MKAKFLLFTAVVAMIGLVNMPSAFAQRYTISPSKTAVGEWNEMMDDLEIFIYFYNTTDETFDTKWELGKSSLPDSWDPSMCDNRVCFNFVDLFGVPRTMSIAGKSKPAYMQGFLKLAVKPQDDKGIIHYGEGEVSVMIYDVASSNNVDTVTFIAKTKSISSVNDNAQNSGIEASPNPAGEFLTVKSKSRGTLSILSTLGTVEFETQIENGYSYINLGGISQGVHFLNITDASGKKSVQKFIKQ